MPKTFWRKSLVFHWRKISYFNFTYVFPLVFTFYILVPYIYSQTRATVSINNETLNIRKYVIIDFVHKIWFAIATFKNLLNMAVLVKFLKMADIEKVGWNYLVKLYLEQKLRNFSFIICKSDFKFFQKSVKYIQNK